MRCERVVRHLNLLHSNSPFKKLKNPVTLEQIKADKRLQNIGLVKQGRLSVMSMTAEEFDMILELSERKK